MPPEVADVPSALLRAPVLTPESAEWRPVFTDAGYGTRWTHMAEWLVYWMAERHRIALRRVHGVAVARDAGRPWTTDRILSNWRFCHVFRELDRVTRWLREVWARPHERSPMLPFAMAMARVINWPDTLAEVGFPHTWDPARLRAMMQARQARGEKLYTGAYMLRGGQHVIGDTNDKSRYTAFTVLDPPFRAGVFARHYATQREFVDTLRAFPGWGGFLAYEVVTDLVRYPYLQHALHDRWAHAGPGALRGLQRITKADGTRVGTSPAGQRVATALMVELYERLAGEVRAGGHLEHLAPAVARYGFTMREVEHSLCELDKYLRVREGSGTPRARYTYDPTRPETL